MFCTRCGAAVAGEVCAACGQKMETASAIPPPPLPPTPQAYGNLNPGNPVAMPALGGAAGQRADIGIRIGACVIDCLPLFAISLLFGWIPILGIMLMGGVAAAYWLFRDYWGASIGKRVLNLAVVSKDGSPAQARQRILRNVPLAIPSALLVIPLLGWILAGPVGLGISIFEIVMLATKGERYGDTMANTMVVKTQ